MAGSLARVWKHAGYVGGGGSWDGSSIIVDECWSADIWVLRPAGCCVALSQTNQASKVSRKGAAAAGAAGKKEKEAPPTRQKRKGRG